jgi:uncharacterized phage protein gp47/JayE
MESQFLRDYRLAAIDGGVVTDVSIAPGSDAALLATPIANLALIAVTKVQETERNINIFTSTGTALDDIRDGDGLPVVNASGATGKIKITVAGATTILNGQQFIYPNGVRGVVVGNYVSPSDGAEISVKASEVGSKTNLKSGEKVRFTAPPANLQTEATVSTSYPLTGGTDLESDERKRQRILNARRNRPAGGNWAQLRKDVLDNFPAVQDCYVYPALGGPSSVKVVPVRDYEMSVNDYSRECSSALLSQIRQYLWGKNSSSDNIVVQAVEDQLFNASFEIEIPDSALVGGNGLGWVSAVPWPALEVADSGRARVTTYVAATRTVTINAATAVSPVAGQTRISWWSKYDFTFYSAMIVSVTGGTTAWVAVIDKPLVDSLGNVPANGDFISPEAKNIQGYADKWVNICRGFGAGENTEDADRLPRAKRHPFISDEDPSSISAVVVSNISIPDYPEITSITSFVSLTEPTVPADVDDAPGVLVLQHLGFYPA